MALTKAQKEMQKCIPFVKALSQKDVNKETWREVLLQENMFTLISILAILEIGRDSFFSDTFKPKSNPETFFSRHRNVTVREQQNATKDILVKFILNKLLLHKYMETAYTVLSLENLDDASSRLADLGVADPQEE